MQPAPPPAPKLRRARGRWIWVGAGVVVLALASFVAYRMFLVEPPPPPPVVKKAAPAQTPPPQSKAQPPATAAPAVPLPGQELIDAGQSAINAKRAKEQARVDALAAGENPPEKPVAPPPAKPPPSPTAATATTTLAPGVSATSTSVLATGPASAAFRSFVANSKIGGVRPGTPARALINNALYRAGDVVNTSLGVRFDSVDAEARTITFRDETGAVVTRKY